jgi:hypothetical protein
MKPPSMGAVGQQMQNAVKQEMKSTFDTAFEQIGGNPASAQAAVGAAQPVSAEQGANIEELKRQEQAKLAELRQRLDAEMQRARQMRQETTQHYTQTVDQQMQVGQPAEGEQQIQMDVPTSIQRGPAAVQAKKGTKEMGKMKG